MYSVCVDYKSQWTDVTPCLANMGERGTLLILEHEVVCWDCGGVADSRVSYVWSGTNDEALRNLGMGASVRHYFTTCRDCGNSEVS